MPMSATELLATARGLRGLIESEAELVEQSSSMTPPVVDALVEAGDLDPLQAPHLGSRRIALGTGQIERRAIGQGAAVERFVVLFELGREVYRVANHGILKPGRIADRAEHHPPRRHRAVDLRTRQSLGTL